MHRIVPSWCAVLVVCVGLGSPGLFAQSVPKRTPEQIKAATDAHQNEFDYLLGDWEFTSVSKEYGKGRGFWSAVRLAEGAQILDEYRVVGDAGETYYASSTIRAYNAVLDQWELVSAEAGTGLQNFGTARKVGAEMHIEQKFGVMSQTPSTLRIRYYDIRPDRFSWAADRSTDGAKTWTKNHLTIEARRIGPARSLGALAPVRTKPAADTSISGRWGIDGTTLLDLQFDGTTVSGTVIWRADGQEARAGVKIGTFDAATGVLKLSGDVKKPDGVTVKYVIQGKLANGALAGTYDFGGNNGDFRFTKQ
jgi:hypothetical protein